MIISGAVITNGDSKASFVVENPVPILRQKDILNAENANTPARRIYFSIQLMYIDEDNLSSYHKTYWNLVRDFLSAAPGSMNIVNRISKEILDRNYYQALKTCKKLIAYEEEAIASVQSKGPQRL